MILSWYTWFINYKLTNHLIRIQLSTKVLPDRFRWMQIELSFKLLMKLPPNVTCHSIRLSSERRWRLPCMTTWNSASSTKWPMRHTSWSVPNSSLTMTTPTWRPMTFTRWFAGRSCKSLQRLRNPKFAARTYHTYHWCIFCFSFNIFQY